MATPIKFFLHLCLRIFQYQSAPRIEANNYFGKHWGTMIHRGADILLAALHQNLELYESHAAPAVFFGSDFGIDFGGLEIWQSFNIQFPVMFRDWTHIDVTYPRFPIIGDIEKSWQFFSVLVPGFVYGKCAVRGFFFLFWQWNYSCAIDWSPWFHMISIFLEPCCENHHRCETTAFWWSKWHCLLR